MSVQFRSRIKSVVDYSKTLNGIGVCCDKNGNKSLKAFYDCFNDGGNYFPAESLDAVDCPPVDTEKGCCCACSFVDNPEFLPYPWDFRLNAPAIGTTPYYDSGVVCNITRCECERLKGKFTPSDESAITLDSSNIERYCYKEAPEFFTNALIDARYPRACCHIRRDPDTGYPTEVVCENTCSQSECAILGNSQNPSVYNNKASCANYLYIDANGLNGLAQCTTPLKLSQMVNKSTEYSDAEFGSCYELEKNTLGDLEYNCNIKPKSLCAGYWVLPQNQGVYCNDVYTPNDPIKVNNVYGVQKMTTAEFDALKLTVGQNYQGGVYIGTFEPGTPVNPKGSALFGNINFDQPQVFYPENVGIGGSHTKWALFVDETPYAIPFIDETEQDINYETSLWDGYYNTYGNQKTFDGIKTKLTNSIRYKNRNGFIDYYLPSIHEMYFYWKYLISNDKPILFGNFMTSSIFNTKYINSTTNKFKINNNGLYYVGRMYDQFRFSTVLSQKSKILYALFFRKIVIQD